MAQRTTGLYRILSSASAYALLQRALGSRPGKRRFIDEHVRPVPGARVLDIGCGTGDMFKALGQVRYTGFDLSEPYIQRARDTFGERAKCRVGDGTQVTFGSDE